MSDDKYIAFDVHQATTAVSVLNAAGREVKPEGALNEEEFATGSARSARPVICARRQRDSLQSEAVLQLRARGRDWSKEARADSLRIR
jgi:hypothetical protein